MSEGISVVINTFNTEKIIRSCLDKLKDFDEIVICDMYSDDKTVEIAHEYGCKVVMYERCGFAEPARNFAIQSASNDWVFVVDSDEHVTPELVKYLKEFVKNPGNYKGLKLPRKNIYWGKFLEMEYPDYIIRFGKKDSIDWPPTVHSHPVINGEIYTIPKERKELAIVHYTSNRVSDFINIINKYTDCEVEKMLAKGKKVNIPYAFFQMIWLTFEKLIIKKGYKDGTHGFIMCVFRGFYKFLAQVKYWEYLKNNK